MNVYVSFYGNNVLGVFKYEPSEKEQLELLFEKNSYYIWENAYYNGDPMAFKYFDYEDMYNDKDNLINDKLFDTSYIELGFNKSIIINNSL